MLAVNGNVDQRDCIDRLTLEPVNVALEEAESIQRGIRQRALPSATSLLVDRSRTWRRTGRERKVHAGT